MSQDIKDAIDEIGVSIKAQRDELDSLRKKQEKGEGGQAEIEAKVAKLDEVIEGQLDLKKQLEEQALALKNVNAGIEKAEDKGLDLKAYGHALRKIARARGHEGRAELTED